MSNKKHVQTYAEKKHLEEKQKRKKLISTVVVIALAVILVALLVVVVVNQINTNNSNAAQETTQATPANTAADDGTADLTVTNRVEMSVKDFGIIKIELYGKEAPITVENFMKYVNSGFYDGTPFHRVMKDFMIQGGGGSETGTAIKGEFSANGVTNNIKHERGVISMARLGNNMDSATSQFFIVHETSSFLDGQYAAFGKVYEGLDVVDAIADVEVTWDAYGSEKSVPVEPITVEYVKDITEIN